MRQFSYTIPQTYNGRKVLHYLRGEAGCSAALVKRLKLYDDGILLNGAHIRTIDLLRTGDVLTITVHDQPKLIPHGQASVEVLYEDDDVIVYNKPAGMPCHQSKGHYQDTLANVFARDCALKGTALTCRTINRLDRDTSGAVLIAKNAFSAAALAGNTDKVYVAAVSGAPEPPCGTIDAPIARLYADSQRRAVMADGQRAVTGYQTVSHGEGFSVVRCTLYTGRTHQIRVHMQYIGCPLLGDMLYGGSVELIARQALHCAKVSFVHPVSKQSVEVCAPFF